MDTATAAPTLREPESQSTGMPAQDANLPVGDSSVADVANRHQSSAAVAVPDTDSESDREQTGSAAPHRVGETSCEHQDLDTIPEQDCDAGNHSECDEEVTLQDLIPRPDIIVQPSGTYVSCK